MKQYYRNPKTEELIIWDGNDNSLLFLEKIRSIQFFTERDLLKPDHRDDNQITGSIERKKYTLKSKKKKRKEITEEMVATINERHEAGVPIKDIALEFDISISSVWNKLK